MLLLSIVQLDHSINQLKDPPVVDTIHKVIDHLSCNTPNNGDGGILSSTTTSATTDDNELRAKVIKSIVRYRRNIDRWTSFTSLLLKSIAYYRSINHHTIGISSLKSNDDDTTHHMNKLQIKIEEEKRKPIVDLPRTEYNRPYIPIQIFDKDISEVVSSSCRSSTKDTIAKLQTDDKATNENYNSMMNISHQYPWVCMIQQQLSPSKEAIKTTTSLIGLDIVIFDPHINEYTPTITNFLSNFKGSFTSYEWDRITNYNNHRTASPSISISSRFFNCKKKKARDEQSQLQEFYLRWSIKESYTKAIGLGMNINFHEFETMLFGIDIDNDNDDNDGDGIWSTIMRQDETTNTNDTTTTTRKRKIGDVQLSIIGKVKYIKPSSKPCECWEFIFIPLDNDGHTQTLSDSTSSDTYNGCACICRGPIAKDDIKKSSGSTTNKKKVSIEELTLVDLIQLHGSSPL